MPDFKTILRDGAERVLDALERYWWVGAGLMLYGAVRLCMDAVAAIRWLF